MGKPSVEKACPYFLCPSVHPSVHPPVRPAHPPIPPIKPIIPNPYNNPHFYSSKPQQLTKGFVKAIVLPCKSYRFTL